MLSHTVGIFSVDVWILLMIFRSFVSFVRSFVDGRRRRTRARHRSRDGVAIVHSSTQDDDDDDDFGRRRDRGARER